MNEEIDGGEILAQDKFRVDYEMNLDQVEDEVHKIEHKLYVKTAAEILKGEK